MRHLITLDLHPTRLISSFHEFKQTRTNGLGGNEGFTTSALYLTYCTEELNNGPGLTHFPVFDLQLWHKVLNDLHNFWTLDIKHSIMNVMNAVIKVDGKYKCFEENSFTNFWYNVIEQMVMDIHKTRKNLWGCRTVSCLHILNLKCRLLICYSNLLIHKTFISPSLVSSTWVY